MRSLLLLLFCAVLLGCGASLQADEDTIIKLKGDKLAGLPEQYEPAQLDLKEYRLRIASNEMRFPPLLRSLFEQPHKVELSASWYHSPKILPPYLLLRILPKSGTVSHEILFNLNTLDVIDVSALHRESASSARSVALKLSAAQQKEIRDSIKKVP